MSKYRHRMSLMRFAAFGKTELTVEDVVAVREGTTLVERMPTPVITNVEVNAESPTEDDN